MRFWFTLVLLLLIASALVWRMVYLMVLNRGFLLDQSNARVLRVIDIPAYRGMIVDRNNAPLAVSTPVDSVWINPSQYASSPQDLSELCKLLNVSPVELQQRLQDTAREFMYLRRRISPALGAQVKALGIPGVYLQREYRRYYPESEITAHVLGFTNVDDQGQEGLELTYNDWLKGTPGKKQVIKDRLGHIIANVKVLHQPQPGHDLTLSIDRRIQYLAYRELKETVERTKAESGSVLVVDVKTGELLAMVNAPSYNPNNRPKEHDGRYRNRAITDVFEPGSTAKAFSVANAFMHGNFTPTTPVNTNPGWMVVEGKMVRDIHNNGAIDVTRVLQKSSNIGVTKLTLAVAPETLWNTLHNLGFGQPTSINFPGESSGFLPFHKYWHPFTLATLSFGYGFSVTNLQLAQAYTALAAGGIKRPLSLLRIDTPKTGEQVIDAKVARQVLTMLETVVEEGGGAIRANVPGYTVAGKTGTVRIVGPHGYDPHRHIGFFVGVAPAANPRLVISVMINDPQAGGYYGGITAAPVFSKVMAGALRIMEVPPEHQ
jgi:cell division protein FtsI (penicillin-binding protein 3)